MKTPLSWLREYVDITLPPQELGEKLTMSGNEVGAIESAGSWENIVVGFGHGTPHCGVWRT